MTDLIKSMKLYIQVERVFNELRELGLADTDPVSVDTLVRFDQYHYEGVDAVDQAIQKCQIAPHHHVLEVGAGIGGPARYLAHRAGCHVTALELQADLNDIGRHLTARAGLSDSITHQVGDFLEANPAAEQYDALASWLAFLHIPNRKLLFERCFDHLKPNASLFIEDFSKLHPFTAQESHDLESKIYCHYVPSPAEYVAHVEAAGFIDVQFDDMSTRWTQFVHERFDAFRSDRERQLRVHGAAVVEGLDDFYATMTALYEGGNLGGIRLTARKPGVST
ncbi:MAG: cyclopropane fatty-acyl-phospholipid synthase-like methyltransferase [Cellvibrionaceae bacterium]|jgi:cyclopropane fatty-acyl-phospholipid synthase-like methyltransferase